jgi:hypothetical protein
MGDDGPGRGVKHQTAFEGPYGSRPGEHEQDGAPGFLLDDGGGLAEEEKAGHGPKHRCRGDTGTGRGTGRHVAYPRGCHEERLKIMLGYVKGIA